MIAYLQTARAAIIWGVVVCLLAVVLGAFGAHWLQEILLENQRGETYRLANQYQFYHGLALIAVGAIDSQVKLRRLPLISALMVLGIVIFCGSLYLLSLTNIGLLGAITPIGGLSLIVAWLLMVDSTLRT